MANDESERTEPLPPGSEQGPQLTVQVDELRGLRTVPSIGWQMATLLSVMAALYVGLGEINHVISQFVNNGKSWSPTQLTSISTIFHPQRAAADWASFHQARTDVFPVQSWLRGYALVDVAFAITYGAVALRFVAAGSALRTVGVCLIVAGAVADLGENLVMFGSTGGMAATIVVFTVLKWVGVVGGVAVAVFAGRSRLRAAAGHVFPALYTHRYTALVVLPLAVLGLAKGTDILEQLPDIQRQWLDHDTLWGKAQDPLAAGAVLFCVGIAVLYVGRQRTDGLWMRTCENWVEEVHPCLPGNCPTLDRQLSSRPNPDLHIWFFGPGLLGVLAWLVHEQGGAIRQGPLIAFVALPVIVGVSSLVLRKVSPDWLARPTREPVSLTRYKITGLVGDVLVGLLAVIAGLGSIRAFTGLVVLYPHDRRYSAMVAVGLVAVLLTWWVHTRFLARIAKRARKVVAHARLAAIARDELEAPDGRERSDDEVVQAAARAEWGPSFLDRLVLALTPGADGVWRDGVGEPLDEEGFRATFRHQRWAWVVLVGALAVLLLVASTPVGTGEKLGVIGTFEAALGSISVVVATTVILLQRGGSPEVFWPVRIPYAPVTTLLVVAAVFAGTRGGGVHDIRPYDDEDLAGVDITAEQRPRLDELFQKWLKDGDGCSIKPAGAQYPVRPMLLYAAEGGGIRAAYWTAKAVDRIATPSAADNVSEICRSAFMSSGASGGSVGLTIATQAPIGSATEAVKAISGPDALAAASDGLVLRDTLYAATGVPVPPFHGDPAWSDRGTLIEQAWENSIEALNVDGEDGYGLERPFLSTLSQWTWKPPGALVINSTSTSTSCRTLVSQLQVASSPGLCSKGTGAIAEGAVAAANSTDLLSCTDQLRSTTAALLTARFPYVTPSGVVDCQGTQLQIVDGGYVENFGLGTMVDLAPALMHEVRTHNNCVLSTTKARDCAEQEGLRTLVAPMLVYLDNGTGSDLAVQPAGLDLEVLVPPLTLLSAKKELYSARSQLARAESMFATTQLWDASGTNAESAKEAVDALRKSPVAIVFQATEPQVAGPLGWVLSQASMASMDAALVDLENSGADELTDGTPVDDPLFDHTISDVLAMLPGG